MANERRLFGTDGIRGPANVPPMTPEVALRLGMAVAAHFRETGRRPGGGGGRRGSVVIGKDTRLSGYMFETALAAGVCAMGAEVMLVGPLPTPGIAYVTRSMRADAGVVISASHNAFADNGIKLFAADGFKLPDDVEAHLEALMAPGVLDDQVARGADIGRATRIDDAGGRYITHVKHAFPSEHKLDGLKIVVDCAHGAAYKVAPTVLRELGAEVIALGVAPSGLNINDDCGAMHPARMCAAVREHGADLGVALDGDADRAVFCDRHGALIDGDAILAICARELHARGGLRGGAVVATIMSNMGLDRCLREIGVDLVRTPVGDRYVVEHMVGGGYNLGGEQSGHLVFLDHGTTGDGIVAALQVLAIMQRSGRPLDELARVMTRYPQLLQAIVVAEKIPLERLPGLTAAIAGVEAELGRDGRVVVRYSGTEAKLRVMLEGPDLDRLEAHAGRIGEAARRELGAG